MRSLAHQDRLNGHRSPHSWVFVDDARSITRHQEDC